MPVQVTAAQVALLAPSARSSYRSAFDSAGDVFARHAIDANPLRVAHFMAQVLHECGGLIGPGERTEWLRRTRAIWH